MQAQVHVPEASAPLSASSASNTLQSETVTQLTLFCLNTPYDEAYKAAIKNTAYTVVRHAAKPG